ncbi:hypothetical protein WMF38_36855 [Sorangium sp. So ce118]
MPSADALDQAAAPVLGSRLLATDVRVLRDAALGWFERARRAGGGRAPAGPSSDSPAPQVG